MTSRRTIVLGALAALAFPLLLEAHEGHAHQVLGTVSSIGAEALEVKATDGKTVRITLNAATKFTRGKTKVTPADVQVGERVVVDVGTGKEPLVANAVQLAAPKVTARK